MKYLLSFILVLSAAFAFAYQNVDSLTYNLQKTKINGMLDARFQKFGEYDQSLKSKTGIFGLKTKRDMQKSIDILTAIIKTDNDILKETKTLLDFKTYQQEQISNKSQESEDRSLAYMRTINKLQTQTESLNTQLVEVKKSQKFFQLVTFALGLAMIAILLFVFRKISSK
jgi:hypothetical protein